MRIRTELLAAALAGTVSAGLVCATAQAQGNYPVKPVRIVVPFSAGGSPDILTRMLVKTTLEPRLGQPMTVENRPGGNSTVGMGYLARQAPDGYTIGYGSSSGVSSARALVKNLSYDPLNDLTGIIISQAVYFTIMVRNEEKGTSLAQFIEKMRKTPDKYAVGGTSSTMLILNKMIETAAKTTHVYVPYASSAIQLNDLLGGRLGALVYTMNPSIDLHRSGQAHAMAVTSTERVPALPGVPTLSEVLPGVWIETWTGFFAPAKTPRPIIDLLYQRFAEAIREPTATKYMGNSGRVLAMPPAEIDAYVRKDEARWTALFKAAGVEPE